MKLYIKRFISCAVIVGVVTVMSVACAFNVGNKEERKINKVVAKMTLDEKISQMIIPAIRTWNGENVTDLSVLPELKEALQKHQYGGIILFASNISGNEQVTRLVNGLKSNNDQIKNVSTNIPYLTCVDEEGGVVIRLSAGTRMTGNMAIGASTEALYNAEKTGELLGQELEAVGFNVDFAPVIDVNNNPNNPVIGTRAFSDDPVKVAELGAMYAQGLAKNNIIATYKHYPGHGDTGVDSHIGTPSVEKTYEQISATELVPFKKAIENGADMIMTAHITYPLIDEEVTYGDGVTKGYYPATMSKKMITEILRTELGFNGVVVADALEMAAIQTGKLVPGAEGSVEYNVNIAEKVINAGVDILLVPIDMTEPSIVTFYDDYIAGIAAKVEAGEISEKTIDESVKRILRLKTKYGIFDVDGDGSISEGIETRVERVAKTVGTDEHHNIEMDIARKAITLVKNEGKTLPVSSDKKNIVVLGRLESDEVTLGYAIEEMRKEGFIGKDNDVFLDFYYDSSADEKLHYTDELKEKLKNADIVLGFSYASGSSALDKTNAQYIALHRAIKDVHKGGGKFVLISENLPYDAAIYQSADAIILAYMGSGLSINPADRLKDSGSSAFNANIIAAIETVFGFNSPSGRLPVNVPNIVQDLKGNLSYGTDYIYQVGYGLKY